MDGYDPQKLKGGWVHIGNGHFFRAHVAVYQELLLRLEGSGMGITAVNLKNKEASDLLKKLNFKI